MQFSDLIYRVTIGLDLQTILLLPSLLHAYVVRVTSRKKGSRSTFATRWHATHKATRTQNNHINSHTTHNCIYIYIENQMNWSSLIELAIAARQRNKGEGASLDKYFF